MSKAEVLKKEILRQYRSVRQFAIEMEIPYSTLVTALERGIEGMAYGTVIKMCDKLSLNPVDFGSLEREASLGAQLLENRVMQNYVKLNQLGRDKVLELMDDFVQIEKYKAKSKKIGK
ncbi:MAG: transcriptional regulator [Lachnospiraceae bacterium]|nr:transcriptional regulator [Lachnospiraceae bacterium]